MTYLETMQAAFMDELEKIATRPMPDMPFEPHENRILAPAWADVEGAKTPAHKIREALSMVGGGATGAGLGAGAGALGAMGLRALGANVTPGGGAMVGGTMGGALGLGLGGILGDTHGQSDVNLGKAYERYAKLEDKTLGTGEGPARAAQKVQGRK